MGLTCLIKLIRFLYLIFAVFIPLQLLVSIPEFTALIVDFQNGGRPPSWIWYDVISDHPRLVFDGPNILLKLHVDCVYTLEDISIFIFGRFGLKLPIHAPLRGVLGILPPNEFRYCRNPKRTVLGRKHVV